MRISDWSSDVCSSDLARDANRFGAAAAAETKFGALEQPIDDHEATLHPVIDELGCAVFAKNEKRRHVTGRDRGVKLDEQLAAKLGRASCRERVCKYV